MTFDISVGDRVRHRDGPSRARTSCEVDTCGGEQQCGRHSDDLQHSERRMGFVRGRYQGKNNRTNRRCQTNQC